MKTVRLTLSGMHCDSCIEAVRQALSKRDGVGASDVRLNRAEVTFDPDTCGMGDIAASIRDAGDFQILGFTTQSE